VERHLENIPEEHHDLFSQVCELIDNFCGEHLNDEYLQLALDMAVKLFHNENLKKTGRPVTWAGGIIHALGFSNFLTDPDSTPHMSAADIAEGFGMSKTSMMSKSKTIRNTLGIYEMDPAWCIPSMLEHSPFVWTVEVGGLLVDMRTAPRALQEEALRHGVIPYIPEPPAQQPKRSMESMPQPPKPKKKPKPPQVDDNQLDLFGEE
jgi:hypothetical protein